MDTIVECVPNFSEGRNMETINAIADAVRSVQGARLLNVEPDKDYNRVVVTFVGAPEAVVEAAFRATKVAAEKINMRVHKGEHPRMGATDVCPFIPVRGVTMEDCAALATIYGKRVADELHIPIFLYGAAARTPERKLLSDIRKGEYEGLEEKLRDPQWKPDYGDAAFNAQSGATVTGARTFLIAYNVNLATNDVPTANEIAQCIRESGRPKKDANGNVVKNERGVTIRIPGTLRSTQAMGVLLERANIAQVSINILDFHVTPIHAVFEEVKKEAASLGTKATGSEIVGLIPLEALLQAGRFYAAQQQKNIPGEKDLVALSIESLGLSQLEPFIPEKKIIEYQL
ncbi:MAG TPA: glutamate formimidoyltransferase [Candidatus Kapabacteria bacterium]|nr:glutamate formimidoyltransferase [Candidatus Kapabacteria bacterium]